jgi:hypothetical protein
MRSPSHSEYAGTPYSAKPVTAVLTSPRVWTSRPAIDLSLNPPLGSLAAAAAAHATCSLDPLAGLKTTATAVLMARQGDTATPVPGNGSQHLGGQAAGQNCQLQGPVQAPLAALRHELAMASRPPSPAPPSLTLAFGSPERRGAHGTYRHGSGQPTPGAAACRTMLHPLPLMPAASKSPLSCQLEAMGLLASQGAGAVSPGPTCGAVTPVYHTSGSGGKCRLSNGVAGGGAGALSRASTPTSAFYPAEIRTDFGMAVGRMVDGARGRPAHDDRSNKGAQHDSNVGILTASLAAGDPGSTRRAAANAAWLQPPGVPCAAETYRTLAASGVVSSVTSRGMLCEAAAAGLFSELDPLQDQQGQEAGSAAGPGLDVHMGAATVTHAPIPAASLLDTLPLPPTPTKALAAQVGLT